MAHEEPRRLNSGLTVVYRDSAMIALNKPVGMPVQPDRSGDRSLFEEAAALCGRPAYLVHRIDRPVSGIVLFASRKASAAALSELFRSGHVDKRYWAIVDAPPPEPVGSLHHRITKNGRTNRSTALPVEGEEGDSALLHFRTVGRSDRYWFLEVTIETGRHHQIRAQLAAVGCSIKGDLKYGARRSNPGGGIHLHARSLAFRNPLNGNDVALIAEPPAGDPLWKLFEERLSSTAP